MDVDAFFWSTTTNARGLRTLRFMPPDKRVVLGLMSSKQAAVEPADDIKRRIDEAAAYIRIEQCALSHQCGFSSTAHGNELGEDDQWRKLARAVEVAADVWGYQPA
jgi:5-methyltetrahydropteroyltriglutamate--homocysteine methyltransferase